MTWYAIHTLNTHPTGSDPETVILMGQGDCKSWACVAYYVPEEGGWFDQETFERVDFRDYDVWTPLVEAERAAA